MWPGTWVMQNDATPPFAPICGCRRTPALAGPSSVWRAERHAEVDTTADFGA
jgi:hypothetical protein